MKTLIEIHALQNFVPSNLNRDDTGAPKDAFFGGSRRARVSSQCIKRAVRQYFVSQIGAGILSDQDVATRTKRLTDALVNALVAKNRAPADSAAKARLALAAVELTVKDDGKSQYLMFLGQREIDGIAGVIHAQWDQISSPVPMPENNDESSGKKDAKVKKEAKAKKEAAHGAAPELKKALARVLDGGKAVDVALFGRMLADMPEKNQDASCQVAHALSTHAVEREFDFYTAVDDLKPEDSAGADMMGTVEFNSACFYRYAVVDWGKLVENLQDDEVLAAKGLRAFIDGFVIAEPTGKQNTFAAHNPPEFVAVSVRRDGAPRNLANAFEIPVRVKKGESLTGESAIKLIEKAKSLQKAFGGHDNTFVLNLTTATSADFGEQVDTLKDLLEKTVRAVQG